MFDFLSTFKVALQRMIDRDDPSNTIIETEMGIGTIALVQEELAKNNAKVFVLNSSDSGADLFWPGAGGVSAFHAELLAADTLIVDRMEPLEGLLADLVADIVQDRTILERPLPTLKRVVLIYPSPASAAGKQYRVMDTGVKFGQFWISR